MKMKFNLTSVYSLFLVVGAAIRGEDIGSKNTFNYGAVHNYNSKGSDIEGNSGRAAHSPVSREGGHDDTTPKSSGMVNNLDNAVFNGGIVMIICK